MKTVFADTLCGPGNVGFGGSLVRHAPFAACKTAEAESTRDGIAWLTTEASDYASSRKRIIEILEFLGALGQTPHFRTGRGMRRALASSPGRCASGRIMSKSHQTNLTLWNLTLCLKSLHSWLWPKKSFGRKGGPYHRRRCGSSP